MNDSPLKLTNLVCFSHLRWNFVYQRPQHIISRFAKSMRVFFIEEPIFHATKDRLEVSLSPEKVVVVVPHLQYDHSRPDVNMRLQDLVAGLLKDENICDYIFWYYTPMALLFSRAFQPSFIVYDCMDELSAFKSAPPLLKELEQELMNKADVVFAGGQSLYESKKKSHPKTHLFPSSIDRHHFEQARAIEFDLPDQESIPHPRIGFFGVIDERMDIELVEQVALLRPDWHFVFIGPVVKIDPKSLPTFHNLHYLGKKSYNELPHYLAGWDVAMIPFARNESTRFISPTKTPEYLAAGKPVVSTPINDVIRPYGNKGLVKIAGTPDEFVRVVEEELNFGDRTEWLDQVDRFISQSSWDKTWSEMFHIIRVAFTSKSIEPVQKTKGQEYV